VSGEGAVQTRSLLEDSRLQQATIRQGACIARVPGHFVRSPAGTRGSESRANWHVGIVHEVVPPKLSVSRHRCRVVQVVDDVVCLGIPLSITKRSRSAVSVGTAGVCVHAV